MRNRTQAVAMGPRGGSLRCWSPQSETNAASDNLGFPLGGYWISAISDFYIC